MPVKEGEKTHEMPAGYSVTFYSKLGRKTHVYRAPWWEGDLAGTSDVSKRADDGSKFSRGAWWGQGLAGAGVVELVRRGELIWMEDE